MTNFRQIETNILTVFDTIDESEGVDGYGGRSSGTASGLRKYLRFD
jgi:hypothetical protein